MRKQKESKPRPEDIDPDAIDLESPEYADVDWDNLEQAQFQLDPVLVESIRSRALKQVTLRVGEEQIHEAKLVAQTTGTKYHTVLRRWLAEGARKARTERRQSVPVGKENDGKFT